MTVGAAVTPAQHALGHEVTDLLSSYDPNDPELLERLFPLVWWELRKIARSNLSQWRCQETLQVTSMVNELYVKLRATDLHLWETRGDFYAYATRAMQQILIDRYRKRMRNKRGGGRVTMVRDVDLPDEDDRLGRVDLDDAIEALRRLSPSQAKIIELRFLAGYSFREVAERMGISERTAYRQWRTARAWLVRELVGERPAEA